MAAGFPFATDIRIRVDDIAECPHRDQGRTASQSSL